MDMILLEVNGLRTDALLLALGSDRMRVAFRNGDDAIELRREGEQWISEEGSTFVAEAWITDSCEGLEAAPRTMAAGAGAYHQVPVDCGVAAGMAPAGSTRTLPSL